jgi:hypothetical protein
MAQYDLFRANYREREAPTEQMIARAARIPGDARLLAAIREVDDE